MPHPPIVIACPHCRHPALESPLGHGCKIDTERWSDGFTEIAGISSSRLIARCGGCDQLYWLGDARRGAEAVATALAAGPAAIRPERSIRPVGLDDLYEAIAAGVAPDRRAERSIRMRAWWAENEVFREATRDLLPGCAPLLYRVAGWLVVGCGVVASIVRLDPWAAGGWFLAGGVLHVWTRWTEVRHASALQERFETRRDVALEALRHSARHRDNLTWLSRHLDREVPAERLLSIEALRQLGRFSEALEALDSSGWPDRWQPAATAVEGWVRSSDAGVRAFGNRRDPHDLGLWPFDADITRPSPGICLESHLERPLPGTVRTACERCGLLGWQTIEDPPSNADDGWRDELERYERETAVPAPPVSDRTYQGLLLAFAGFVLGVWALGVAAT